MYFRLMAFSRIPPGGNAVPLSRLLHPDETDFRPAFSKHCGFPEADILYAGSGTSALYVALQALKRLYPERDEVVLPAWCCPSVPQAILQAGLKPVQVDLDPDTFAYPSRELATAVSDRTLTLLLVHYFGIPQPRPVLENPPPLFLRDCAQDFDFRNAGETDCAFFYSFGRGKSLNSGHGGALCLAENSPLRAFCDEVLETLPEPSRFPRNKALLIEIFSHPIAFRIVSGLPFLSIGKTLWEHPLRFTRIHPDFFRWGMACFNGLESHRNDYAGLTRKYVAALKECAEVFLPFQNYEEKHLAVRFPLRIKNATLRKKLRRQLNRKFGGVTGQYPTVLASLPGVPAEFPLGGSYPGCETIAAEILTFPVTAWLLGKEDAFLKKALEIIES
jgi:dTDP-4-amino-4,6-dideoxygalactose transaminase